MNRKLFISGMIFLLTLMVAGVAAISEDSSPPQLPLKVNPSPIASDKSVKWDYDIVYVRAPRFRGTNAKGRKLPSRWAEIGHPTMAPPDADLMLLHPNGSEEVLVQAGKGSVQDPYVSFDGQWVYYSLFHDPKTGEWTAGADIYKIHVPSRKIVRLTLPQATPNTSVADWSSDFRSPEKGKARVPHGIYNMHPCPLPGGKVVFVSNRDSVKTPNGYPTYALQLYVMDDDGGNVEKIGYLNVAGALHPVILKDGRITFSSLESQGLRGNLQWGIWSIHPDGTNWGPVVSAFLGDGAADAYHFQTQLSDGSIVIEEYYNQNTAGFGTYYKLPPQAPKGYASFGSASLGWSNNKRDPKLLHWSYGNGGITQTRRPFSPVGMEVLTRFAPTADFPAGLSDPKDPKSPRVGRVQHPCGAPDNHLLTVWTPGAGPSGNRGSIKVDEETDAGLYLLKDGKPIWGPGEMLLIKNDPNYNEMWPRPLVSYKRIYGVEEPRRLAPLANDGKASPHLPAGTPFGLVGTSSLYKRESATFGAVPPGSVTAKGHPYLALGVAGGSGRESWAWGGQGSDAGIYENSDIHAIRILFMEPATSVVAKKFHNSAAERLRIAGEFPVRKFGNNGKQPLDPDGNPDTSFLAKVPANVAWTFQTLDKDGMVLNMAQTWHQVRPGEIRNNCGGCHAHSQKPTDFQLTAAAKPDYAVWDLTNKTPLLTTKKNDQLGKQWDAKNETGVRFAKGPLNVEYYRDIRPILDRSCVACHNQKDGKPAGSLALDDDTRIRRHGYPGPMPATYYRLAGQGEQYTNNVLSFSGSQPKTGNGFNNMSRHASPYIVKSQSRRSLLIWKLFGRRLDGLPKKPLPGRERDHQLAQVIDFKGSIMPPPKAVEGTYARSDGKKIKVAPMTDEDRRTVIRWIDLGCPIDLDFDPANPQARGRGWMLDDQRPTLTLTSPRPGVNAELTRILIGMHDYYTGLDMDGFEVVADFAINGVAAGENLAKKFRSVAQNVWELKLSRPITDLPQGKLMVAIKDRQGNLTRIERTFSVVNASSRVPRLIEQLGHADFKVREKAAEELAKLGQAARRALKEAAAHSKDPEARRRGQAILKEVMNRDRPRYALLGGRTFSGRYSTRETFC
ncbi:MAG TPA: hypothetical protein VMG10_12925 [Gemmataceae bacterium]|nr:hypothetical protein [Gemmataceae bacterium]